MATITATANIAGVGTVPKIVVSQPSTPAVYRFIKLNGRVITAHNRKYSVSDRLMYDDIALLSGNTKRFIKAVKKSFKINFTYLPSQTDKTVDGQYGRDYLQSLVTDRGTIELFVQDVPNHAGYTYSAYMTVYKEDLIRRDYNTGCYYYNVSLELTES